MGGWVWGRYIVGQAEAKRAVAIALRNRWRRHKLPDELRSEVGREGGRDGHGALF